MANTWFNEDVYLQNKLTAWQAEAGNADKDLEALKKAIADEGMTPESHFLQFGADEGLSPNEFFVIDEYVANQVVFLNDRDGVTTWTAKSFKDAVKAAGMTLWSHYQQYGWAEANPSNSFDAEQYFADKLTALQEDPATKAEWADKTVTDVKDAFEKAGIDPVSHYFAYGKDEGVAVTPVDTQPNTLTEALAALDKAKTELTNFLKGIDENADGNADYADVAALKTAVGSAESDVAGIVGASYIEGSDATKSALITAKKAVLEAEVTDAKAALTAQQEKVNKVAGLSAAYLDVTSKTEAAKTAADALTEVNTLTSLEAAKTEGILEMNAAYDATVASGVVTIAVTAGTTTKFATGNLTLTKVDATTNIVSLTNSTEAGLTATATAEQKAELAAAQAKLADWIKLYNNAVEAQNASATANAAKADAIAKLDHLDLATGAAEKLAAVGAAMTKVKPVDAAKPTVSEINDEVIALTSDLASAYSLFETAQSAFADALDDETIEANATTGIIEKIDNVALASVVASDIKSAAESYNTTLTSAVKAANALLDFKNLDSTDQTKYKVKAAIDALKAFTDTSTGVSSVVLTTATPKDLVSVFEAADTVNPLTDGLPALEQAIETKQGAIKTLDEKLAAETKLIDLLKQGESLEANIKTAEEKFVELGYSAPVNLTNATSKFATSGDDLFIADNGDTTDTVISNFGLLGNDALYLGSDYVYNNVKLGAATDKTAGIYKLQDAASNLAVKEIFMEDTAAGLVIYQETKVYGSETGDYEKITLAGIKLEEITFVDGLITIA